MRPIGISRCWLGMPRCRPSGQGRRGLITGHTMPRFETLWLRPLVDNAYREATGQPIVQGGEGEKP